ncbi:hypothetical protein FACS189426_21100 [Bacteroidia bacterium]|nr:hypothetical protein FACS189426_21100 [Bacteroidia bacterium]
MVTIYSPSENTKRLDYIARHIFKKILGVGYDIVEEKEIFLQQSGACINYSSEKLNHGLQVVPHGLLFETGVREISDLNESEWQGFFCFFKQSEGDVPFDIFAASFYLLTLYEEYFPKKLDEHGRFDHKESLAYRKEFLEIPIIDRWAYLLKDEIAKRFPALEFKLREYNFWSTYDIDHPYLYLKKGLIKTVGSTIGDLLKLDFKNIVSRFAVHLRLKPDPYMKAIQLIQKTQKAAGLIYFLFVLLGKKGKYGRSAVYPTPDYYKYLKELSIDLAIIGLHPSYNTCLNLRQLEKEKKQLEKIMEEEVIVTRQHFLRMRTPETFKELILAEFEIDFTLAFAHAPGFRSGTAFSYCFYDIEKEESTGLLLHPTTMMDSTLITHLGLSPEEALLKIKKLIDECKKSGGDYVSLWHNSNLAGDKENNPWINVFIESFQYAISLENNNFVSKK